MTPRSASWLVVFLLLGGLSPTPVVAQSPACQWAQDLKEAWEEYVHSWYLSYQASRSGDSAADQLEERNNEAYLDLLRLHEAGYDMVEADEELTALIDEYKALWYPLNKIAEAKTVAWSALLRNPSQLGQQVYDDLQAEYEAAVAAREEVLEKIKAHPLGAMWLHLSYGDDDLRIQEGSVLWNIMYHPDKADEQLAEIATAQQSLIDSLCRNPADLTGTFQTLNPGTFNIGNQPIFPPNPRAPFQVGLAGLNPQPEPPGRWELVGLNPQPEPPGFWELVGLNPQPEPPSIPNELVGLDPQPEQPGFWGAVAILPNQPGQLTEFDEFQTWAVGSDSRLLLNLNAQSSSAAAVIDQMRLAGRVHNDTSWPALGHQSLNRNMSSRSSGPMNDGYSAQVTNHANRMLQGMLVQELARRSAFDPMSISALASPPEAQQEGAGVTKVTAQDSTGAPVPGATFTFVVNTPSPEGEPTQTTQTTSTNDSGEIEIVQENSPPGQGVPGQISVGPGGTVVGLIPTGDAAEDFHPLTSLPAAPEEPGTATVSVQKVPQQWVSFAYRSDPDPNVNAESVKKIVETYTLALQEQGADWNQSMALPSETPAEEIIQKVVEAYRQQLDRYGSGANQVVRVAPEEGPTPAETTVMPLSSDPTRAEIVQKITELYPDNPPSADIIQIVVETYRQHIAQSGSGAGQIMQLAQSGEMAQEEIVRRIVETYREHPTPEEILQKIVELYREEPSTVAVTLLPFRPPPSRDPMAILTLAAAPTTIVPLENRNGEPVTSEQLSIAVQAVVDAGHALYGEVAKPRGAEVLTPGDPNFTSRGAWGQRHADQWALHRIGLTPQEEDSTESTGWLPMMAANRYALAPVTVAVIGSGVDYAHPDLITRMWVNHDEIINGEDDDHNGYVDDVFGWNFRDGSPDVMDFGGHDTHVAGIIAAEWNGYGIVGINPCARIMALKAADMFGQTDSAAISQAIFYAVDNGARVINISYSGEDASVLEQLAIQYAVDHGVLVVAAAGNQASDTSERAIAGYAGVLTVASMSVDGERAGFSNWGQDVDITAPGMDILSLRSHNTDFLSYVGDNANYQTGHAVVGDHRDLYRAGGTSFSAPMVSGVASLLWSMDPGLSVHDIRRKLLMSAEDLDVPGWDQNTGAGLLNARRALAHNPGEYVIARLTAVVAGPVQNDIPTVEVQGVALASGEFITRVQIVLGERPTEDKWQTVFETSEELGGMLTQIPATRFNQPGVWSLRVLVTADDEVRESRGALNIQ